jgi:AcrR family transcriptional regulator
MRYPAGHKAKTRAAIEQAAGRAFRAHGAAGVGVDGLAQAAGLTSGAFYRHFKSKQAAFATVAAAGAKRFADGVAATAARAGDGWLGKFAGFYLGPQHRADLPGGCALPSLTAEVARGDAATRAAWEAELVGAMRAIAAAPGFAGTPDAEARAWALVALLAGGVMLARSVDDEATAEAIAAGVLAAVSRAA